MSELHVERVHTEPPVLNIGGDVGALIIYTDADRCSEEIELDPKWEGGHRLHNQVHERRFSGRSTFAAVYPELPAGEYDILGRDSNPVGTVRIAGGEVATVDWRA